MQCVMYIVKPLSPDSELRTPKNVYSVPHMGGPTIYRRAVVTMRLADNILKLERGEAAELIVDRVKASRMTARP